MKKYYLTTQFFYDTILYYKLLEKVFLKTQQNKLKSFTKVSKLN